MYTSVAIHRPVRRNAGKRGVSKGTIMRGALSWVWVLTPVIPERTGERKLRSARALRSSETHKEFQDSLRSKILSQKAQAKQNVTLQLEGTSSTNS